MLGTTPLQTALVVGSVMVAFTTLGGFLGVVVTDLLLFVASMTGAIATAWVAVNLPQVDGLTKLMTHPEVVEKMAFLPDFSSWYVALTVFVIPLAVQAFNILLTIGAGTGLLFLLRWFWWRINAFSEIVAMLVSFVVALYFEFGTGADWASHQKLLIGIALTTAARLAAAYMAPGTDERTLDNFYRLTRPSGPGWQKVRERAATTTVPAPEDNIPRALMNVFLGCVGTYAALFAIGSLLYRRLPMAALLTAIAALTFFFLLRGRSRSPGDQDHNIASENRSV